MAPLRRSRCQFWISSRNHARGATESRPERVRAPEKGGVMQRTTEQSWSTVPPDDARSGAAAELERVFVQYEMAKLMRWPRSEHTYPGHWRRAARRARATTWLTAAELEELAAEVLPVLLRFRTV